MILDSIVLPPCPPAYRYHNAVRNALLKEKWKLTDPLILKFENEDEVRIDLGAERLLIANRGSTLR